MKFLMAYDSDTVNVAIAQINLNCSWPDSYTETWDTLHQAYEQEIWYIGNPSPDGYIGGGKVFTYDEMMAGVEGMTPSDGDSSWWPPADE